MVQTLWKTVWQFLIKLKHLLLYFPMVELMAIYTREMKIYVLTKLCISMFIAALSLITKNWTQLRCLSSLFQGKQTVAHTYCGILFRNKNKQEPKPRVCTLTVTWKIYRLLHTVNGWNCQSLKIVWCVVKLS